MNYLCLNMYEMLYLAASSSFASMCQSTPEPENSGVLWEEEKNETSRYIHTFQIWIKAMTNWLSYPLRLHYSK